MYRTTIALAAAGALASAAPAGAHVTVHPNRVPAGAFTVINVRVPNERDNASTRKVQVQLPPGFLSASYTPRGHWTAKVNYRKLAKPVDFFGEKVTREVGSVTWTADGAGAIRPGQFAEFPLSVKMPDSARTPLTFKALQTYSNGEVVRWIGAPESESPAPQIAVAAKDAVLEDIPAGAVGANASEPSDPPPAQATSDDSGPSTGLVVVSLIIGGLGLIAGLAGLAAARRRPA